MNYILTKTQEALIPDLVQLHKLAARLNIRIEAISTPRLKDDKFTTDYEMELLGVDCYSSELLYKLKLIQDEDIEH